MLPLAVASVAEEVPNVDEIIAAGTGIAMTVEPMVRERAAFSCDIGTPRSRLAARWPHLSFDHVEEIWWPTTVETDAELGRRCHGFRTAAQGLPDWRRVAVITHWGFIRGITGIEARNGELVRFDPHVLPAAPAAVSSD